MALHLFPHFEALIAHLFGALFATDAKIYGKKYRVSQVPSRAASDDYWSVFVELLAPGYERKEGQDSNAPFSEEPRNR